MARYHVGRPGSCPGCGEPVATDRDERFGLHRQRTVDMRTGLAHWCPGRPAVERASAEASGAVTRLADALRAESEAREDFYRQRASGGRPAGPSATQPSYPAEALPGQAAHVPTAPAGSPAAPEPPRPSLVDEIAL